MLKPMNRLLTTAEAAEFLHVSVSFLAKARLRGEGPQFRKLGSAVRYTQPDLEVYVKQTARRSTSERMRRD